MREKIQKEIERCKELLAMYDEMATGFFEAVMIRNQIKIAENILREGNWNESEAKIILESLELIV